MANWTRRGLLAGLLALIGFGVSQTDDSTLVGGVVTYDGFGYDFGEAFGQ